jgi:hypothetical protein
MFTYPHKIPHPSEDFEGSNIILSQHLSGKTEENLK